MYKRKEEEDEEEAKHPIQFVLLLFLFVLPTSAERVAAVLCCTLAQMKICFSSFAFLTEKQGKHSF